MLSLSLAVPAVGCQYEAVAGLGLQQPQYGFQLFLVRTEGYPNSSLLLL